MSLKMDYSNQADIDKRATQYVDSLIVRHGWERFALAPDYRIDYDIEPREDRTLTGVRVAVQQKAKRRVKVNAKGVVCSDLDVEHVKYWVDRLARPLFIFLIDITDGRGWWLFVQEHVQRFLPRSCENWRDNKRITLHIPENQTLEGFHLLEVAMKESYSYMAGQNPVAFGTAMTSQLSRLNAVDPRLTVAIQATEGAMSFILSARSEPVPFSLTISTNKERHSDLYGKLVGQGLPVAFEPGELTISGSPLFNDDVFGQPDVIHLHRLALQDVLLSSGDNASAPFELRIPSVQFTGGLTETRFSGELALGLAKLDGVADSQKRRCRMVISLNLSKWLSRPANDLPYFPQLSSLIRTSLRDEPIKLYVERDGERRAIGELPQILHENRSKWEEMLTFVEFIEGVRIAATRLDLHPVIPVRVTRAHCKLTQHILEATDYSTWPSPAVETTTTLREIPKGLAEEWRSQTIPITGSTRLQSAAKTVGWLGLDVTIPAQSYTLTHMTIKGIRKKGYRKAEITWKGSADTTVTVAAEHL